MRSARQPKSGEQPIQRETPEAVRPPERTGRSAVTILEIAQHLNVSHSTVSRVLNNKPHTYISDETRRRVEAAARAMGYRPNLAARSLRDARSNMVGIFAAPNMGIWSGPAVNISEGLTEVLHERQMHLFFALVTADDDERSLPAWRFDGAVLLQQPSEASIRHLLTADRPFVAVNEQVEHGVSVLVDEAGGVRLAMEHLWELGHRRIAYANASQWHYPHYSVSERQEAYLQYAVDLGIAPDINREYTPPPPPPGTARYSDQLIPWLRETILAGTTAILAYDHMIAVDILVAAQQLLLRIPQDFSLICFNKEIITEQLQFTVIASQGVEMGRVAAKVLLQRMDAEEGALLTPNSSVPSIIRVPQELIPRASTAPPRR